MSEPLCNMCGDSRDGCGSCLRWRAEIVGRHHALKAGVAMLSEYVRQTMESNPEWRGGLRAMVDALGNPMQFRDWKSPAEHARALVDARVAGLTDAAEICATDAAASRRLAAAINFDDEGATAVAQLTTAKRIESLIRIKAEGAACLKGESDGSD